MKSDEIFYIDFCHDLTGTKSDHLRHMAVRAALLLEFRRDLKTMDFFKVFADEIGIAPFFVAGMSAMLQFANLLGVEPHQVFKPELWPETRSKKVQKARLIAGTNAIHAIEKFLDELVERAELAGMKMVEFVRDDLKMPWPWLSLDLVQMFNGMLTGCLFGELHYVEYSLRSEAPAIDRNLFLEAGPKVESLKQLECFYKKVRDEIMGPVRETRSRVPDVTKMQRNASWFYRNQIKGESKKSLAREYHQNNHGPKTICAGDRSTVQAGIAECKRVLELVPFRFQDEIVPLPK